MSQFIKTGGGASLPIVADRELYGDSKILDERRNPSHFWQSAWPSSRLGAPAPISSTWFQFPEHLEIGGVRSAFYIDGVTKDSAGAGVGNVLVQGFITSSELFVGECLSGPTGEYVFCTDYPGVAHFLVAYKAGSPDYAGTTVNTLVPSSNRNY